jgi:hypothetical protein
VAISQEDKDLFLALVRSGHAPPDAAQRVNPSYTASMFRKMVNNDSKGYDAKFAGEYLRARAEGRINQPQNSPAAPARTTTLSGNTKAMYLTEEMLDGFLEEVANGVPISQACAHISPRTTLSQVNRRAHRDPEFAEKHAAAREEGYPIFQERIRSKVVETGFDGEYRALRDLASIHLPEFQQLLTRKHEISNMTSIDVRLFAERVLPDLPAEMIDQIIGELEKRMVDDEEPPQIAAA